jgi:hypothetical protein
MWSVRSAHFIGSLICLAPMIGISGCGGDDSTGSTPPVATVTVAPNPASVAEEATVQLSATLKDANGNTLTGRSITWSSDATSVATVDGNGLVTGVAAGSATVTATSETKTGASALTVTAANSEQPIQPGESGFLFTTIDLGALAQSSGVQQASRRPDADFSRIGFFDWVHVSLRSLDKSANVPGSTFGLGFNAAGGSLSRVGPSTESAASRAAPITSSVLFAGGYLDATSPAATRRAVLFQPSSNEFTELQMTAARIYYTLTPLSGSRALLAGGFDGDAVLGSAEIFTESTQSFATTGSMGTARGRHAAAVLPDGRVLITGGLVPDNPAPATIDSKTTEIFDPSSGTFTPGPDMSVARFNHSAIALDDGRVLVLGGNHLSSAELYDPASNTFSAAGAMNAVHGLGHQAVKLLDGKVLVLGGDQGTIQPSAVAELFDPSTNQFTRIDDMTTTRMLHFAVVNQNDGKVLIGGGQNASGDLLASTEIYDPATETFTASLDMPAENSEQAVVFVQQ